MKFWTLAGLTAALLLNVRPAAAADSLGKTRFGRLSVEYGGPLLLDDKVVEPEIRGNESLDIVKVFHVGSKDVALLRDNGGSGCPAQLMFVTLSKFGVTTSSEFGTCAAVSHWRQSMDSIFVTMPLLYGHGTKKYVFRNGLVMEDGKPIK